MMGFPFGNHSRRFPIPNAALPVTITAYNITVIDRKYVKHELNFCNFMTHLISGEKSTWQA